MLLLAITGKGVSSADLLVTAVSKLGMRDIEGFCDSLCPHPRPKRNSLHGKPSKRMKKVGGTAKVNVGAGKK